MFRSKLGIYIIVLAVALIGLLWIQYSWISYSIEMQDEKFTTKVNVILDEIVKEVEESYYCIDLFATTEFKAGESFYTLKCNENGNEESLKPMSMSQLGTVVDTIENFMWFRYDDIDTIYSYKEFKFGMPATMRMEMNLQFKYDTNHIDEEIVFEKKDAEKITINSFRRSIQDNEKIINVLDTLLKNELEKIDISHDFQYAVTELNFDSIIYSNPITINPEIFKSKIRTIIFDESFFFKAYSLYIYFPGKNRIIFNSIWLIILSSVAVVCAIIILILFFIRTMLHQRKLSEMKSDFIHNMTHEFKTPISNIDLALHTFRKQKQESNIENDSILDIIGEENSRLKDNVDLILQTSFMEYEKIKFNKEKVDINDLIHRILKTCENDLVSNGSTFEKKFEAKNAEVLIDETHFTNAVCNIIDNALKYSPEDPLIIIKTENIDNKLVISIKDNGIGISAKDQKRIFDKFYRISTGKVHDTKGFGLGLTYAKYVVEAHHGELLVESETGKGSEFRIILAL